MATAGYQRASGLSVRASLGSVLDGRLEGEGRTHAIGPGVVGAIGVAKRWALAGPWFITGSLGFSASRTSTTEAGANRHALTATDFRVGGIAGRSFGPVSPYVLARGFAGPVAWNLDDTSVTGSDTHFFQLGAGASYTARGVSFLVDVSALGEQSASLAMAYQL